MEINHSQMCTEILEYTDEHKSFVCCLSSLNLLHWDEIVQTDAIETLAYFLDAVYSEFIQKAENIPFMEKALLFAKEHRSIGIGVLGWHSLLQSKLIPFEGLESKILNAEIFRTINDKSLIASMKLATIFGEPKMLEGYGQRFTTRLAIAPTTSSSFILGQVSPSIEPLQSNYFIKDLAKGKFVYRNPYLKKLLKEKDQDTPEVWNSILLKGGSVQHLTILDDKEKSIFKTFGEISQLEIVQQAAQRQKFIDQGQSLNLMIHPDTSLKEVNALFFESWKLGIKTLYYQRSVNMAQEVSRNLMDCSSCEG
jgi:ribonucleoside-diphosphate reductase alpha chain